MDNNDLISIIMSTYNERLEWIVKSVNSILNQTYKNFEFIIVIDNPQNTDLLNYLKSLTDDRIRLIFNSKNIGLVRSLNKALEISNGKYIARMDADDISEIDRLEKQVHFLNKNKDIVLLATDMSYIDEDGNEILIENKNFEIGFDRIKRRLRYENVMSHPTFMIRKEILCNRKINKYRDIFAAEDYDLVCRIISNGYKVENIKGKLLKYRIRNNSITRSNELTQYKIALYIQKLYRKNKLDYVNYDYIRKIINSKFGYRSYKLSNDIKMRSSTVKGSRKLIINFVANCISYYSFKKMVKKILCYTEMKKFKYFYFK